MNALMFDWLWIVKLFSSSDTQTQASSQTRQRWRQDLTHVCMMWLNNIAPNDHMNPYTWCTDKYAAHELWINSNISVRESQKESSLQHELHDENKCLISVWFNLTTTQLLILLDFEDVSWCVCDDCGVSCKSTCCDEWQSSLSLKVPFVCWCVDWLIERVIGVHIISFTRVLLAMCSSYIVVRFVCSYFIK